jgi:purine-binding chemotaxis protein CheW
MSEEANVATSQYLTFILGAETYGFEVGNVREVLELVPITRIPRMPDHMSGVINVRGSVVPVIDLRLKLGMPKGEKTINSCIIVIEVPLDGGLAVIGVLVDSVQEVVEFGAAGIEPPPRIGTAVRSVFLRGIAKREDRFVMIMDIGKVLEAEDVALLHDAQESPQINGVAAT